MQRKSIGTFGLLPGLAGWADKPRRIWILAALAALLLLTAVAEGQSDGVAPRHQDPNDPGQTGPGQAAPWSVEGTPTPSQRPRTGKRDRDRERDDFRKRMDKLENGPRALRCQILEVEELGRIYVQEPLGDSPFWIQLPPKVKIRTIHPESFGGRKKLTIDDLEIGQQLVVTLKGNTDEIVKVMVRPAKA